MHRKNEIVYSKGASGEETLQVMKAVGVPLGVFILVLLMVSSLDEFGQNILPMATLMWVSGVCVGAFLPSMRLEVLSDTMKAVSGYCVGMMGLKILVGITSGISPEMIGASFHQAISTTAGTNVSVFITNAMMISSVMAPLGFIGMQISRIVKFRKTRSMQKAFGQARNIHNSGNERDRIW